MLKSKVMPVKFIPLYLTTLFYTLFNLISALKFDVVLKAKAIPLDFSLQPIVAYLLIALSRRPSVFLILHALIMGFLYVGNAIKTAFFGGSIMPDDAFTLRSFTYHICAKLLPGMRIPACCPQAAASLPRRCLNFI